MKYFMNLFSFVGVGRQGGVSKFMTLNLIKKITLAVSFKNYTRAKTSLAMATLWSINAGATIYFIDLKGEPCGVEYFVRCYVLETEKNTSHRKSTVSMAIRCQLHQPMNFSKLS